MESAHCVLRRSSGCILRRNSSPMPSTTLRLNSAEGLGPSGLVPAPWLACLHLERSEGCPCVLQGRPGQAGCCGEMGSLTGCFDIARPLPPKHPEREADVARRRPMTATHSPCLDQAGPPRGRSRRGGALESTHSVLRLRSGCILRLHSALRASFPLPGLLACTWREAKGVLVLYKGGLPAPACPGSRPGWRRHKWAGRIHPSTSPGLTSHLRYD